MGTSIELSVGGVSLSYAKNHMGFDWGYLFQEGDLIRRREDQIDCDNYVQHADAEGELSVAEEAFVRSLARVLPRLAILGHSLESARTEYEALLIDAAPMENDGDGSETAFLNFEEFCALANRYPLAELSGKYVDYGTEERDTLSQGRYAAHEEEFARLPWTERSNLYWSEKST